MQRGTALVFFGMALIVMGVAALKLTDQNIWWALIVAGAVTGCTGGISVSQRAQS
jgi:hypothetical protein